MYHNSFLDSRLLTQHKLSLDSHVNRVCNDHFPCPPTINQNEGDGQNGLGRTISQDQIVHRINRKGGVTFAVTACIGLFATIIFMNQLDFLITIFMKAAILISPLLSWYWISATKESRTLTDAMLLSAMKKMLNWSYWPSTIRSWANQM
jgi:hypothetical protein